MLRSNWNCGEHQLYFIIFVVCCSTGASVKGFSITYYFHTVVLSLPIMLRLLALNEV